MLEYHFLFSKYNIVLYEKVNEVSKKKKTDKKKSVKELATKQYVKKQLLKEQELKYFDETVSDFVDYNGSVYCLSDMGQVRGQQSRW